MVVVFDWRVNSLGSMARRERGIFNPKTINGGCSGNARDELRLFHQRNRLSSNERYWNSWIQRQYVTPESDNEVEYGGEGPRNSGYYVYLAFWLRKMPTLREIHGFLSLLTYFWVFEIRWAFDFWKQLVEIESLYNCRERSFMSKLFQFIEYGFIRN